MELLGYAGGHVYHNLTGVSSGDVYRGDYADAHDETHAPRGAHWLCTRAAWPLYLRAYGVQLHDAQGNPVDADGYPITE